MILTFANLASLLTIGLIIVSVLSCSLYYLFGYSKILAWMRPNFPGIVQELLVCSACSGFWLGGFVGLGSVGILTAQGIILPSIALTAGSFLISGLWAMTTTPILFHLVLDSLKALAQDLAEHAPEEVSGEEDTPNI